MNTIITETTDQGEVPIDIYSKLANDRVLFIYDYVDDKLATDITATLMLKDAELEEGEEKSEKITLLINSEGGDIRSVFMIYDMMQILSCEFETICVGAAMNEVVLLLAAGTAGMRRATKHAVIAPSQLVQEQYYRANITDAKSVVERIHRDNKNLMTCLAKKLGKKAADVATKFERKVFMSSKQAKAYGIIDAIIGEGK